MIYITYKSSSFDGSMVLNNVWSVDCKNVEQRYFDFMIEKSKEINIVVNPSWLNIMNWKNYHQHLSVGEYGNKEKQWGKILRQWSIDKFIAEILKGKKENYKSIERFIKF